jgi:hypothetical protein
LFARPCVTLIALTALLAVQLIALAAAAAPPAPAQVAELDALLATYRGHGLPLPPPGAPLVLVESGTRYPTGKPPEPVLHLAFLLEGAAAPPGPGPWVLIGTETEKLEGSRHRRVAGPDQVQVDKLSTEWWAYPFALNAGLATAVQCHAVGYTRLAAALLPASLAESAGHGFSSAFSPARAPAQTALAIMTYTHLLDTLARPGTAAQRAALTARMERVLGSVPGVLTKYRQAMMKGLRLSLVPSSAPPGSVGALLDALVDEARRRDAAVNEELVPGPVYRQIVHRGFAAVPELIAHLDDRRITRWADPGFNNFAPRLVTLGERAADLLQGIAGAELGRDWLRRQQGYGIDPAAARAWWEKARPEGEAAYAARLVVPSDPKQMWPVAHLLELLAHRHPGQLPDVYRRVLARRPPLQSWTTARAVARSSLPAAEKRALFVEALKQDVQEHRRTALSELKDLDAGRFTSELVRILDALPRTPSEPYWGCREAAFANLVMETADPAAWQALRRAARRADVGLRMQLLEPMGYAYIGQRQRAQRIAFLADFLDDATVRDAAKDPRLFTGPYAGFTLGRIRVQDLAALRLAGILGIAAAPDAKWTRARWDALRTQVRAALPAAR